MISEDRVNEVYKLVYSFCNKQNIYDEDIKQSMVWHTWEMLVKHYDENKSKLSTFVFIICNSYMRDLRRKKYLPTISMDEDDYLYSKVESQELTPLQQLIQQENNEELNELYNNCSDLLKDWLDGETQENLSEKYNIAQPTVSRKIKKELDSIRKKVMSNE